MITEDTLRDLLAAAGQEWELPPDGAQRIVDAAREEAPASGPVLAWRPRRVALPAGITATLRSPRVLSAAAGVVLVAAAVTGGLVLSGHHSAGSRSASTAAGTSAVAATGAPGTAPVAAGEAGHASAGTGQSGGAPVGTSSTGGAATPSSSGATGVVTGPDADRVVQTGTVELTVPAGSLGGAFTDLQTDARQLGGIVQNSTTQEGGTDPSVMVTLRVPVANFAAAVSEARSIGKVTSTDVTGQDVTGQYVDLTEQIAALQQSRATYLQIESKATTIGSILAVQQQIDSVQQQLDELIGQQQLLANQSSMSTLTVTVTTPGHRVPPPHHAAAAGLTHAIHRAVHAFVTGAEDVIAAIGPVLLIALVGLVLVIGGRLGWRLLRRQML